MLRLLCNQSALPVHFCSLPVLRAVSVTVLFTQKPGDTLPLPEKRLGLFSLNATLVNSLVVPHLH